jgi:hypothetical protein
MSPSESYAAVRKLAVGNLTKPPPATNRSTTKQAAGHTSCSAHRVGAFGFFHC